MNDLENKLEELENEVKNLKELVEENNSILRSERASKRLAFIFKLVYWLVFLGAGIVIWSYLEPIFTSLNEQLEKMSQMSNTAGKQFQELNHSLDKIKNVFK